MSSETPVLKTLTRPLRQAILITIGCFLICLALIIFAVWPARKRLHSLQTEIANLNASYDDMEKAIAGTAQQRAKTAAVAAERDAVLADGVIEPLLGSFAMRGKALVDPLAQKAGFTINSVKEDRFIKLQVPNPAPEQLYGRQQVEFTGQGTYSQITAFVSLTEASLPQVTLSSISILSQLLTPESHKAIITFEWPVKGEKRSGLPLPVKGEKRSLP